MATLPTDRDTSDTAADHATDHNTVHGLWNKLTTKGDLLTATGAQAYSRLGVGSNGQVLTADSAESTGIKWAAPSGSSVRGCLANGYVQVTANQTGISSVTDLTSLTRTVDVNSGERIKITAHIRVAGSNNDNVAELHIQEGATVLALDRTWIGSTGSGLKTLHSEVVLTPSAGSHTYKLTLEMSSGSGSVSLSAGATFPAFILVEGIGT